MTAANDNITAWLTSFGKHNPAGLQDAADYIGWRKAAQEEQTRRATDLIKTLTDADLAAIPDGTVNFNKIAAQILASKKP